MKARNIPRRQGYVIPPKECDWQKTIIGHQGESLSQLTITSYVNDLSEVNQTLL
jgi:hypothetical protein